jgi:hypothetical protein
MKIFFVLAAVFFVVSCRPVHTTKQYYEEYVNPKPSIDYEASVSADVPAEFLDDYYAIDSKIVRLVDQLDLMDSRFGEDWIALQKSVNPWIKRVAVLDAHQLFVSGDDSLGYDPLARDVASGLAKTATRVFVFKDERTFLVHAASTGSDAVLTTLVEVDVDAMAAEIPDARTVLFAAGHVYGAAPGLPAEALTKIESSDSYSGSMSVSGQTWYWIRSMGSDNLVYFHAVRG